MSCITIELYFKKVISRLLVCTSASKGSSAELITGTKQIRHIYPIQIQEIIIQRTKTQTHRSRVGSAYLQGHLTSSSMATQERFCYEDWYHSLRDHFSCSKHRLWYPAKWYSSLSCSCSSSQGDEPTVLALINIPNLGSSGYLHWHPINSYKQHR